jgi:hypothetical protein
MKSLLISGLYLSAFAALVACSSADSETGSLQQALEAQHCGGNIANAPTCPDGFECVPDPNSSLPFGDVGGICQAASDDGGAPDHGRHHRHHRHGRH